MKKQKSKKKLCETLQATSDFTIVTGRKKQEFLALEVHFLLILLPTQGRKGW